MHCLKIVFKKEDWFYSSNWLIGNFLQVVFDLSLARGLDYYTGVIYEAILQGGQLKYSHSVTLYITLNLYSFQHIILFLMFIKKSSFYVDLCAQRCMVLINNFIFYSMMLFILPTFQVLPTILRLVLMAMRAWVLVVWQGVGDTMVLWACLIPKERKCHV